MVETDYFLLSKKHVADLQTATIAGVHGGCIDATRRRPSWRDGSGSRRTALHLAHHARHISSRIARCWSQMVYPDCFGKSSYDFHWKQYKNIGDPPHNGELSCDKKNSSGVLPPVKCPVRSKTATITRSGMAPLSGQLIALLTRQGLLCSSDPTYCLDKLRTRSILAC